MNKTNTGMKEAGILLPLGVGFVMASSNDLRAAIGMGVAVLLALFFSAVVISALRKVIPQAAHLPIYILIITGFVSLIQMVMEAHFPGVVNMLGVHLAALSVSAVPYRDAEHVSGVMGEGPSVKTAIETGLLFTFVMAVCAVIREILGSGSIWGIAIPFMQDFRISALSGVFGGYLVLAIVFAVMRKVSGKSYEEKEGNEQ